MKNFVKKGSTVNYLNSGGSTIASGDVVIVGKLAGVAQTDILVGSVGAVLIEGVFNLPKAAGFAISQGDQLYYNAVTGITKTVTDALIGIAFESALSGDLSVEVRLLTSGDGGPISADAGAIKPTTNLPATAATYADLPAARTDVAALNAAVETRLDNIETKLDAYRTALRAAGLMA